MQKESLGGCYQKHSLYMYRLAYTRLHNKMDAEDAVQSAFVQALRYCDSLQKDESFLPWLIRIVLNECNNIRRVKLRRPEELADEKLERMPIPGVEERAVLRMDLSSAFGSLEEKYRKPIEMLFLHGYSSEETARRLKITRSSVSGMIRRGKEKLREAM
jgi:RNA polymerase sigma-70 factor (ECF subfamily)